MKTLMELNQRHRSDKQEVLFVHIPRTGGTSIANALGGRVTQWHRTIGQWQARRGTLEGTWSFAIVRNPYDQIASWWRFSRALSSTAEWYGQFESFGDWLRAGLPTHWQERPDLPADPFDQWAWVSIDGELAVDRVYDFQQLEICWYDLWGQVVDKPFPPPLPHLRASKPAYHPAEWTDDLRAIIAYRYPETFEYLM